MALTFMAKFDAREGNSCHIHCSFRGTDGATGDGRRRRAVRRSGGRSSPGSSRYMRELTLLLAPEHQLLQALRRGLASPRPRCAGAGTTAPARFRLVGHGASLRLENRIPGGDVNPYLATAAVIAAGLAGIEERAASSSRRSRATPTTTRTPSTCPTTLRRGPRPVAGQRFRAPYIRRRRGRPLRQHGRRRAGGLRRGGHRLGALPGVRAVVSAYARRGPTTSINPGHRGGRHDRPPRGRRGDRRRGRPGAAGLRRRGGRSPRPTAARLLRRFAEQVDDHVEELAAAGGAQLRAHDRQRPLGGRQRPRRPDLLQRGAGAAVRPADPGGRRRRHHVPRAARRRRRHRAVELPDADRRLGASRPPSPPATPSCSSPPSSPR